MGYGPVVNGKQRPITPYVGSWAHKEELKRAAHTKRIEERERLLRRLRCDRRLGVDTSKTDQICRCIEQAKKLCAPAWRERHDNIMTAKLNRWYAIQ